MQPDRMKLGHDGTTPALWLLDLSDPSRHAGFDSWRDTNLVSDQDLQRAGKYRHAGARAQFLGGRALLRHALRVHAGVQPSDVAILFDENGKPRLETPLTDSPWHFNLSHSGDVVACVLDTSPIGVDVEATARNIDHVKIAERHFSVEEGKWVAARPIARKERFTALWVLKEAYLKAVGVGISVPLSGVQFDAVKHGRCRVQSAVQPMRPWHCRLLRPRRGYWLAVCSEAHLPPLPRITTWAALD